MKIWKRLRLFLVGFGFGLILLYFFYKDKAFDNWLPENRIKHHLSQVEIIQSPLAKCQTKCLDIADSTIQNYIQTGEIIFSESQTKRKPCPIYYFKCENDIVLRIEYCEENGKLVEVIKPNGNCECN